MVDAVINPSEPKHWTIYEEPGGKQLGYVQQAPSGFMVLADKDNILTSLSLGPYPSKEAAMAAIAAKIGGNCSVGA